MSDELRRSVSSLYQVFAGYPAPPHNTGCPDCVADADHGRLVAAPLDELTTADLSKYAFRALTTWGDERDFKHFLPRLLDLLSVEPYGWADPMLLLGKLTDAGWERWPDAERAAVERWLQAFWAQVLHTPPGQFLSVWMAVRALDRTVQDVAPYLDTWRQDSSATAVGHVAELVLVEEERLSRDGSLSMLSRPTAERVRAFLLERATLERLERGARGAPEVTDLARAYDILKRLKA